ncbi:MAG: molybdopterin molybdotransferase MoeA [Deltaproteobacteria bacterium]|nr:molybdopterin molybdotransferase MoeA [Deltaproteobacteria bacterium]
MGGDVRMRGFQSRTAVDDVWRLIAERIAPIGDERVPFTRALGRILAADVVADRDVPPHPKSAMDGYAVRAADLPGRLRVVGELMAADRSTRVLACGEAVRIMTGARVLDGADAVVMVEKTRLDGDTVIIEEAIPSGANVLARGEDLRAGSAVLGAGRRIRPQDLAMLATVGSLEVPVKRRPRVRLIPTGTELIPVGATPQGSEVVESNSFMLAALAERDGAETEIHPIVPDDAGLLERAVRDGSPDLVVITGGSSVGQQDLAPVVLRKIGELPVHGVHARPASPSGLGFVGGTCVLLAPGFPVASMVAWDLFGREVVQRMQGLAPFLPYAVVRIRLGHAIEKPAPRVDVVRVVLAREGGGLPEARSIAGGAALLSTTTRADGFLLLPAGLTRFDAGAECDCHLY